MKIFRLLSIATIMFALCAVAPAQTYGPVGLQVSQGDGAPFEFFTKLFFTAGNTTYMCVARAQNESTSITVTGASNASSAVFTVSGGHGFDSYQSPRVTISGGTGNWAGVNGVYQVTVIDSTTFSIPVNSTAFGSLTGTVVVKTTAPRSSRPVWAIQKQQFDTNGIKTLVWAADGYNNICDNRDTVAYQ